MTGLETARKVWLRWDSEATDRERRFDYARNSPFLLPSDRIRLRDKMIRARRNAKLAGRVVAFYETGALFNNARDFR